MDNEKAMSMDSYMLLSWINTKLRDESPNLEHLCYNYDFDINQIIKKLDSIEYSYNKYSNQFIMK